MSHALTQNKQGEEGELVVLLVLSLSAIAVIWAVIKLAGVMMVVAIDDSASHLEVYNTCIGDTKIRSLLGRYELLNRLSKKIISTNKVFNW
ncbi:MAG: hypothetical protein AAFS12_08185 [Cyanobacteria bacterium J06632_19]